MPRKKYDTPHRSRVVKTRMTEEEYADFAARLRPTASVSPSLSAEPFRAQAFAPLSRFPRSTTSCLPRLGS